MPSSWGSSQPRNQTRLLHLLYWQVGSLPLVPPIVYKSVTQSFLTLRPQGLHKYNR